MAREIALGQNVTIVQQERVVTNKVDSWWSTLDDGGCALCAYSIGGKVFNVTLWDAQTTPTYEQIGQYTDTDIENRIKEIVLNS
jgi:hypothetical protein